MEVVIDYICENVGVYWYQSPFKSSFVSELLRQICVAELVVVDSRIWIIQYSLMFAMQVQYIKILLH